MALRWERYSICPCHPLAPASKARYRYFSKSKRWYNRKAKHRSGPRPLVISWSFCNINQNIFPSSKGWFSQFRDVETSAMGNNKVCVYCTYRYFQIPSTQHPTHGGRFRCLSLPVCMVLSMKSLGDCSKAYRV